MTQIIPTAPPVPSPSAPFQKRTEGPSQNTADKLKALREQAAKETPASAEDQAACASHECADFAATDGSCCFPEPAPGGTNVASPDGVERESTLADMINGAPLGEVESEAGDALQARQDELAAATPAQRSEALSSAATQAGLPESLSEQADALVAALPEAQQAEATSYLEQLFTTRGAELGEARLAGLLTQVSEMAGRSYDPRAGSAAELAVSALHDIAAPSNIEQGVNTGTCSATAMQIGLAQGNPERYLSMVDTLAQNQNFEGFEPDWSFADEGKDDDQQHDKLFTNRSPSSRLMQNTIMEYASGAAEDYSSAIGKGEAIQKADEAWVSQTVPALMGSSEPYVMLHTPGEYPESEGVRNLPADAIFGALQNYAPSPDRPVVLAYKDPKHGGHAALITGVEGDRIRYIDPMGGVTKTMSVAEFQERVWSINLPASALTQ